MGNPMRISRRPAATRAGPGLGPRLGLFIAAGALALIATLGGADLLADRVSDRRTSNASVAQLEGLTAQLTQVAPPGDAMRLGVRLTLVNTSPEAGRFNLSEELAALSGADATARVAHQDTFGLLSRLDPDTTVDGIAYLDTIVPSPSDPPRILRWPCDEDVTERAIPVGGSGIEHHGS